MIWLACLADTSRPWSVIAVKSSASKGRSRLACQSNWPVQAGRDGSIAKSALAAYHRQGVEGGPSHRMGGRAEKENNGLCLSASI